jgi:CRISPR-associated helicase Cas3/CRISPR-associated endonuclease Cas3-HD
MYFAHSAPIREGWEPLRDHLRDVAETAARFASRFGAGDEARLAGLLHDLGKYSDLFTRRLEGLEHGLDHWSAGARAALDQGAPGTAAALAIQGHHVGLQSPDALRELGNFQRFAAHRPPGVRVTEADVPLLVQRLQEDGLSVPRLASSIYSSRQPRAAAMLDVRMLFSALVDADFLETEAHFQGAAAGRKEYRSPGPELRPAEALALLDAEVARLAAQSRSAAAVAGLRADLLRACRDAGALPPGLFTLSAPTGAGKTLAMLAFALHHAIAHGLSRIVVAVPFLSIIEQTVKVYRELLGPPFGDSYVLEHHSLAGTRGTSGSTPDDDGQGEAELTARRLAENWDAPLVVTTSVQLLESLFANRPSACRKLHRLAGSVILLDEVQTLPPPLAVATLATLSHLAARYGSTVVFATATQPAFDCLDERVRQVAATGWAPREIVPPSLRLFERARRVAVQWDVDTPCSWEPIAGELAGTGTALCIVNLKRHAQELASLLLARGVPGLYHLSTNLCPAHRERVLSEVRQRLDRRLPCLLISTQCVEAGVDLDFPLVLRAFGPLDAIAQAAGRCNRNGLLPGVGTVRVFLPEDERYPAGGYQQAADATRLLLKALGPGGMDLQSPELFDRYYRTLYDQTGRSAEAQGKKEKELHHAIGLQSFVETAARYRLIDQDAVNVLVPYDPETFQDLVADLKGAGRLTSRWVRRARPHTVNLYRPKDDDPIGHFLQPALVGRKGEEPKDWFILLDETLYDRDFFGLTRPTESAWIA